MSMRPALCDRLRDRAHELRTLSDGLSAPYVMPSTKEIMALAMWSAAVEMDDAAGVIDDLESERAEDGWAREFLNAIAERCGTKDCPSLVAYVRQLERRNRGLCALVSYLVSSVPSDVRGDFVALAAEWLAEELGEASAGSGDGE